MSRNGARVGMVLALALPTTAARADPPPGAGGAAVAKGLEDLRQHGAQERVGEAAPAAPAMIKARTRPSDPALEACVAKVRERFDGSQYRPDRSGGHDIYEAGCVGMALANLDSKRYKAELDAVASYLINRQKANGSWDYVARSAGDTS